jgi:hypothetical protein
MDGGRTWQPLDINSDVDEVRAHQTDPDIRRFGLFCTNLAEKTSQDFPHRRTVPDP